MLRQRILTALVLLGLLLVVTTALSLLQFALIMAALLLVAGLEWTRFIGLQGAGAKITYLASLLLLIAGLFPVLGLAPSVTDLDPLRSGTILLLGLIFWLAALTMLKGYPGNAKLWNDPSRIALMGILVLIPTWVGLVQLKAWNPDGLLVLAVIGLVSAADIGAFFVGRKWGRAKLAPQLSPNKSLAGVAGGLGAVLAYAIFGVGIAMTLGASLSVVEGMLLVVGSIPVALLSIAGDLFESMLKRNRGLKDSGRILPGHGGIMDRIDSLTAAVPLFVLIVMVVS